MIFDAPTYDGGISERIHNIESLQNDKLKCVENIECTGYEHLKEYLKFIEEKGGEGVILRKKNAYFRPKRTSDMLKVKTFHDDDAIVVDFEEGKGKYTGMIGSLICKNIQNNQIIKIGTGLSDFLRKRENIPIGTVVTYQYFELTKTGMPRFPSFLRIRPDPPSHSSSI
jgi:DNA ligase 1